MSHTRCVDFRAFTLIELLVVISIVSMLLAILLPVIGQARESARRAICLGNQRQYGISVTVYSNDAKGYYPGIISLGQNMGQDCNLAGHNFSADPAYQWEYDANKAAAEYIPKGITACPSADPRFNVTKKEWTLIPGYGTDGLWCGTTDYSLKVGFGSNHVGLEPWTGYSPLPTAANLWSHRGFYDSKWPRRGSGFFHNYRVEQTNVYGTKPISNRSIMTMDRARAPHIQDMDINNSGTYAMYRSNHAMTGDLRGAAEGSNALLRDLSARWMHLAPIWGRANLSDNLYGYSGYGEGAHAQYVDDAIAQEWAP